MHRYTYPTQRHLSLKCYNLSLAKVKRHSLGYLIVGEHWMCGRELRAAWAQSQKKSPRHPPRWTWFFPVAVRLPALHLHSLWPPPACLVGLICPQSHCILPKSRREGRMVTADLHERWDPEQPSLAQPVHRGQTPLCSARLASSHDVKTRG